MTTRRSFLEALIAAPFVAKVEPAVTPRPALSISKLSVPVHLTAGPSAGVWMDEDGSWHHVEITPQWREFFYHQSQELTRLDPGPTIKITLPERYRR